MKTALVLRHLAFEDLGAFGTPLHEAGYAIRYLEAGVDDLGGHDPLAPDLLIVLGGPIGAYEDSLYPWLSRETEWIGQRLRANRPTMGICLGAQLIARAMGARVYPSGTKEIGIAPIALTEAGTASCLAAFARQPATLHWHGDTFDLPEGAELLASTALCRNQAFRIGRNIIGFQFHPEADGASFERWLIGHACELGSAGIDIPQLRQDMADSAGELANKARQVVSAWIAQITPE